jgi:hypothetical protein
MIDTRLVTPKPFLTSPVRAEKLKLYFSSSLLQLPKLCDPDQVNEVLNQVFLVQQTDQDIRTFDPTLPVHLLWNTQ